MMHFRDALIISAINTGTSLFSGLVIFSFIGYMSYTQGVEVSSVATSGKLLNHKCEKIYI